MLDLRCTLPSRLAAAAMLLAVAGCAGGPRVDQQPATPPPPPDAPPAVGITAEELVGRWGLASFHKPEDRARTEKAAQAQCSNAYTIGRGANGGVIMHLADASEPQELRLKLGTTGRNYIGPAGPAPGEQDREIVSFDGRVLVLKFVDPEVAGRYGTMVYVRCGARA
jgi:hypothetical protein